MQLLPLYKVQFFFTHHFSIAQLFVIEKWLFSGLFHSISDFYLPLN